MIEQVTNDEELEMAQLRIEELLEMSPDKGSEAWAELDALSEMVEVYEEQLLAEAEDE